MLPGQLLCVVCPDKSVVEDENMQPVWVAPGSKLLQSDKDGYTDVGRGWHPDSHIIILAECFDSLTTILVR